MKTILPTSTLLLLLASACGDDTPPAGGGDTGIFPDVSVPSDSGGGEDATTGSDSGGTDDAGQDAGDSEVPCTSETFELAIDPTARDRPVSAAATDRGFLFGWGDTSSVIEQARAAELASGALEPALIALTDDESSARAVRVADGFALWLDDGGTGDNVVIRGRDTEATDPPVRLLSSGTGTHASPWLFAGEDEWTVGWLRQDGAQWQIQYRTFDADGEGEIQTLPWSLPTARFAMDVADGRHYYAWTEEGNVRIAATEPSGTVITEPFTVSSQSNATTDEVSLAFGEGFGVVTFGVVIEEVRFEVRVRLLNADAEPVRPEQVVSRAPLRGRRPAAAAYAGGYAIAYRASNIEQEHHVRVAFVHGSDGTVVAEYNLGATDFDGDLAGISVDAEGGLGIGWAGVESSSDDSTIIRGARLECGAAWLRCSGGPRP